MAGGLGRFLYSETCKRPGCIDLDEGLCGRRRLDDNGSCVSYSLVSLSPLA